MSAADEAVSPADIFSRSARDARHSDPRIAGTVDESESVGSDLHRLASVVAAIHNQAVEAHVVPAVRVRTARIRRTRDSVVLAGKERIVAVALHGSDGIELGDDGRHAFGRGGLVEACGDGSATNRKP